LFCLTLLFCSNNIKAMMGRTAPFMVIETDISDNLIKQYFHIPTVSMATLSYITHYVRDLNHNVMCRKHQSFCPAARLRR
jgi:hypothetical protein